MAGVPWFGVALLTLWTKADTGGTASVSELGQRMPFAQHSPRDG